MAYHCYLLTEKEIRKKYAEQFLFHYLFKNHPVSDTALSLGNVEHTLLYCVNLV